MPRDGCRITKFNLHEAKPHSARLSHNPVENRQRYATIMFHSLRAVHLRRRTAARIAERRLGWGTSSVPMSVNFWRQEISSKINLSRNNLAILQSHTLRQTWQCCPISFMCSETVSKKYGLQNKRRIVQNIHANTCGRELLCHVLHTKTQNTICFGAKATQRRETF